jgi:prepilin-type N-terminal cleavage/methylation domain-containing protein
MAGQPFSSIVRVYKQISRRTFTLIELLVVIAIIAALAALFLSALGNGQAKTKRLQCLGKLRQWGKALQMFAGDNTDAIPRRGQGVRPLTQLDRPEDWFNALAPELSQQGFGNYVASAGTNADSPPPHTPWQQFFTLQTR